jgi:hypothetical protein
MYFRPVLFVLCFALLLAFGTGCQKSESIASVAPPTMLAPDTIASVHFLGKKRLGITAGAYYFARIWQQPQSAQLERQTLIKLASAPGNWLSGGDNLTTDARSRLWWLLNDLLQEESHFEIHQLANGIVETVFAIRLNAAQAGQWRTNLPVLLEPLAGGHVVVNPIDDTWSLQTTNALQFVRFSRVGDWTVVSAGPEQNSLANEFAARIRRDSVPFVSAGTNLWLEASLNLPRLAQIFPSAGSHLPTSISHLDFSVSGDGANVLTRAKLEFAQPFAAPLEPWRLPVDLMHEPLTSFTAVRGLQSSLADWKFFRDLEMGEAPGQLCVWSLGGSPFQIYLAAPLADARAQVAALSGHLLQKANPALAASGYISFDHAADGNGVTWGNLPDIKPFIKSAGADGWLFAGLLPDTNNAAAPPPAGLINDVLRRTNLVYYDWEVTGPRLQPVLQLGQTARQVARRPAIPMDSAGMGWLGLLIPRLGTTATIISRSGPDELTFIRRSNVGFNAVELHLLVGWLESPVFPRCPELDALFQNDFTASGNVH